MKNRLIAAVAGIAALPVAALAAGSAGAVVNPGLLAGPVLLALLGLACCLTGRRHAA